MGNTDTERVTPGTPNVAASGTLNVGGGEEHQEEAAPAGEVVSTEEATSADMVREADEEGTKESSEAFVNQGLLRWEAARHVWLGDRGDGGSEGSRSNSSANPTAVPLDVDKIIDILFYSSSRDARAGKPERFPRNVPLPQMVDILQDLWEAEGLDA